MNYLFVSKFKKTLYLRVDNGAFDWCLRDSFTGQDKFTFGEFTLPAELAPKVEELLSIIEEMNLPF